MTTDSPATPSDPAEPLPPRPITNLGAWLTPPALDDEVVRQRVPPHSLEAEQRFLGGLLLDNTAWVRAADLLTESDFYRSEHRHIFAAVARLVNDGKPADIVTVHEQLQALGRADDCGGLAYLNSLTLSVTGAANIRRDAEIVRERAVLRKLIEACNTIATTAFDPQGRTAPQVFDEAEARIFQIGKEGARGDKGPISSKELARQLVDRMQELAAQGDDEVTGVRSGFLDLDRMTAGLQPGDLLVLAARPGMGKTALALNIAEHVAVYEGLPVMVFSMGMGAGQLAMRLVGSLGRIAQTHLRTGHLSDDERWRLPDAVERLGNASLFIDETRDLTPAKLHARARCQGSQCGRLGLIVVDDLQLMSRSGGSDENRATELGGVLRGLKALAMELHCPVIALSQLNRSVESRPDKRPIMSDLRESSAIEQDADVIMFIYRDDYYKAESKEPGVAEIIISKQRNGPTGTVRLAFLARLSKFDNLAQSWRRDLEHGHK